MPQRELQPLGGGVDIFVSDRHTFGTDALLLANFAAPRRTDRCCDLGSGCGIIPILWCRDGHSGGIDAVELQSGAVDLLHRSVAHNGFADRLRVHCADIRRLELPSDSYDLVSCNPPYQLVGSGLLAGDEERDIARFELQCTIMDVAVSAARLLKTGGRLCICHRPERLCDCIEAFRAAGIEPKRMRLVRQRPQRPYRIVLLEGRKGAGSGLSILPELLLADEDGSETAEYVQVNQKYAEARIWRGN